MVVSEQQLVVEWEKLRKQQAILAKAQKKYEQATKIRKTFYENISKPVRKIFGLSILVLVVMAVFYWLNFSDPSTDPKDWGLFGEYFTCIFTAANTIAVLFIAYLVYKSQNIRDDVVRYYMAAQERPLLRFVAWEGKSYRLYNMGKGAANMVIVGKIQSGQTMLSQSPYKCYSIPARSYLDIDWSTYADTLYAYCEGEIDEIYLVKCHNDENTDLNDAVDDEHISVINFLKTNAERKDTITLKSY